MDTLSGTVNTAFILDMQRKLYRWSAADSEKKFADLFNIVCDRGTLAHAWQRLARNRGSNTPGTDRVTRKTVEERPEGIAGFLEDKPPSLNGDRSRIRSDLSGRLRTLRIGNPGPLNGQIAVLCQRFKPNIGIGEKIGKTCGFKP